MSERLFTTITVRFVKDHPDAQIPKYAHIGDAGMDLCSVEETEIQSGERKLIDTGLKIAIPHGYEGQIRPRSGLAINFGITVLNSLGTIDSGFRNKIGIILYNTSNTSFLVGVGDRIAQLVIAKCERALCLEVDTLDETERNKGGFGSSGVK